MIYKKVNKIKVAFISYPESAFNDGKLVKSGSILTNEQIIAGLKANNIEVEIFSPTKEERINLRKIPCLGNSLMFQGLLEQISKINECDVVITTNYFGSIVPEITRPVITIFHHSAKTLLKVMAESKNSSDKSFKRWKKKAGRYGLVYENSEELHDKVISIIEQELINRSKCVVAVSEKLKDEITKNYSCSDSLVKVINNSAPLGWQYDLVEKDYSSICVTSVTRMPGSATGFYMKGIDRLSEVFSKIKCDKLLIGSTSHKDSYMSFFEKNIPSLNLKFNLEHDKVKEQLAKTHISLHCSRVESFGLSIVESMLMGNIPISFPEGVAEEAIQDGRNGFIVRSNNEMIKTVKGLLKNPVKLREMAEKAQETVKMKFSDKVFINNYVNLINKTKRGDHGKD